VLTKNLIFEGGILLNGRFTKRERYRVVEEGNLQEGLPLEQS